MAWYNPSDPTQRNWMLVGILLLAAIVPFNMYWREGKVAENQEVADHVESLDIQNRQAGVIIARGEQGLEERMALYERHVARLEELIPAQEEVAALLDDIQARARAVDVDVFSLDPEPTEAAGPYNRTGYAMSVVGEYHAVARFLTAIASLPRIVTPVQVDIQRYGQPNNYPDLESPVQASFRIETYVLPEAGQQLAPAELPGG